MRRLTKRCSLCGFVRTVSPTLIFDSTKCSQCHYQEPITKSGNINGGLF